MDLDRLKSKFDILSVARELGFNGSQIGSYWQGNCPMHLSSRGRCFTIWIGSQRFKCFHCHKGGDVINLVQFFKDWDFVPTVNYLAEKVGLPPLGFSDLSPEERAKKEAEMNKKRLVEDMLTEATKWFHDRLDDYPDIYRHLREHYGFSEELIKEQQIGFAPPPDPPGSYSKLAEHLNSIPEFKGHLALSGLFSFSKPEGPYYDFFKGRIIFPYWRYGKVAYMSARSTNYTPIDGYECYTTKTQEVNHEQQQG